jgi:hypothetical protein
MLFFARSERRLLNCHVPISQLYKTLLKVLAQNFLSFFMFVFVCLVGWFLFCFVLETHYYTANNLRKFFGRILCKNELSWTLALEPSDLVSPRRATKGPFTPRDRANSPWGQLHEISAPFGLEVGLNYTLRWGYNLANFPICKGLRIKKDKPIQ